MDNPLQSLYQAMEHASPIWQHAIYRLRWSHGLVASAYGVAAWLCFLNVQTEEEVQGSGTLWCAATVLLCLLGVNVVLQADVFVTQTFRALAKSQGWYGQRRVLQYLLIGFLALAVLVALNSRTWLSQELRPDVQTNTVAVSGGLLALMLLLAVRLVSAHGTDSVLNVRLLGVSIGRFFELAGIAWVMWGALSCLRLPFVKSKPYPRGTDRHV